MEKKDYGIVLDIIRLHHSIEDAKLRRLLHQERLIEFYKDVGDPPPMKRDMYLKIRMHQIKLLSEDMLKPYGYATNHWFSQTLQSYRLSSINPLIDALQLEHYRFSLPLLICPDKEPIFKQKNSFGFWPI